MSKEFKTARSHKKNTKSIENKTMETLRFVLPKTAKPNRFSIKDHGQTLILKGYDSGCCLFGNYVDCNSNKSVVNISIKMTNISPSGFGIGFATKEFVDFDGWNTAQNGSVMMYGNSEFYTSEEFMIGNEQYNNKNGVKLFKK